MWFTLKFKVDTLSSYLTNYELTSLFHIRNIATSGLFSPQQTTHKKNLAG